MLSIFFFQFMPLYLLSFLQRKMQVYLLIHYTIIRITRKFIHCTNYLRTNMIRNSEAMYTQVIMKKIGKKMNRKQNVFIYTCVLYKNSDLKLHTQYITHSLANFNDISDQTTIGHWTKFIARNTSDCKGFLKQFFKIFLFCYL